MKKLKIGLIFILLIFLTFGIKKVNAALPTSINGLEVVTTGKCPGCGDSTSLALKELMSVEASCESAGYVYAKIGCQNCGKCFYYLIEDSSKPQQEHSYTKYIYLKEPTCTSSGIKKLVCKWCNKDSGIKESVAALGHSWEEITRQDATCTQEGYIIYNCKNCTAVNKTTISTTVHNWSIVENVYGSCVDYGYDTKVCVTCGEITRVYYEGTSYCPDEYKPQGHSYVNGVCTVCGVSKSTTSGGSSSDDGSGTETNKDVHYHTWNEASCEEAKTCTTCGATSGDALGHSYTNCVCTRCGNLETEGIVNVWDLTLNGLVGEKGSAIAELSEDGTLTISGTGLYKIADYDNPSSETATNKCPITGRHRIKRVHFTGTPYNIGKYLFYYCINIEEIIIDHPESIQRIGEGAFFGCKKLKSFTIPENITAIGARAFCHCHSLETLDFANAKGLVRIGHEAARDCWLLENVTLPEGLKVIGYEAFLNCISLKNVIIPSTVVSMGTLGAKNTGTGLGISTQLTDEEKTLGNTKGYNNIFTIDFSRNVGQEEEYSSYVKLVLAKNNIDFDDTTALTKLTKLLTETRVWYYSTCEVAKSYDIEQTETEMEISELSWDISETQDNSIIATLDINGKLTIQGNGEIKEYRLNEVPWNEVKTRITSAEIGEGITKISSFLFYEHENLSEISLPNSLTFIGGYAFNKCISLKTINLPAGITTLKGGTFSDCWSLETFNSESEITSMGEKEFFNCISLSSISIPWSLSSIGQNVFDVDATGNENDAIWISKYNEGNYTNLVITYYEDSLMIKAYAQREENQVENREFNEIKIESINLKPSYETWYNEADFLDTESLVLQINYDNDEIREIAGNTRSIEYEQTQLNTVGNNTITVTYCDKTTTMTVYVDHDWNSETGKCLVCGEECTHDWEYERNECRICGMELYITNISVKTNPNKMNYIVGDTLNLEGLVLTATYNNGDEKTIKYDDGKYNISGSPLLLNTCGNQIVKIMYEQCITEIYIKVEHIWEDGICTECEQECEHSWEEVKRENATCTKEGYIERDC